MPATSTKPKISRKFSLRSLMILVTVVCVVLAFPAGHILLGLISIWLTIGVAILAVLSVLQYPLYRILSGVKESDKR